MRSIDWATSHFLLVIGWSMHRSLARSPLPQEVLSLGSRAHPEHFSWTLYLTSPL
ncbi:hypothetical protein EMPG_15617 [Blastomyces silverae]|uniref:Uncharacterized protein n=1 Tax=Blastomyces silverae TaxID=2060906 RepID=A0A0H1BBY9_9EURO|nr:hypothetical protein EMPG_15617 [Blastomyces silverae]